MTELLSSLVKPAMEVLGSFTVVVLKRQFNYLCCFNSNIQSLNDESEKLDEARIRLQRRVETAKNNAEVIDPEVMTWLTKASNRIQVDKSGIDDEIRTVKTGWLAIKSRFLLSRKVKKTAGAMKDLRESCNFEEISISVPALPASKVPIPEGTSYEFESRKPTEEQILEDLRCRNFHIMGICGMGGVGKTTMVKRIANSARKEHLFDEVVMGVISQQIDQRRIQGDIAEFMGLKLEEESLPARACKLQARLMGRNRILLILDDVWKCLNLENIGIPCGSDLEEGCTIILTSRSKDVLNEMHAKIYETKVLSKTEAWSLFSEKVVGTWVDDSDLLSVAKEVAEECKGLPLALITVGTALKATREERCWKVALTQLKCSKPVDIPNVLEKVYNPIKLSYDFLENERAKSLFLLCSMFPEDHEIPLEYLTMNGIGLHMFNESLGLEYARDTVWVLLLMLKRHFLLLDGRDKYHVKMHDVVRDVAISIASEVDRNLSLTDSSREESVNCTQISVVGEEGKNKLPIGLRFPNLRLLMIDNYSAQLETDPSFFQGKEELNVLSLGRISLNSLPQTTQLLKKLRTLYLEGCNLLKTISIVGELLSLEIFICRACGEIAELPVEIGRLNRLKLLEVSDCDSLKRIASGVISKLVQLEELMILRSFSRWETKGNGEQRENAALCELEHLKNLTRLEIEIEDATLVEEEIYIPPKIEKYKIKLGKDLDKLRLDLEPCEKSMVLNLEEEENAAAKWIQTLLTKTEYLFARGDGLNKLDLTQAEIMKALIYEDCSTVKKLVNITTSMDWNIGFFRHLESLNLTKLPNLEEICDGPIPEASNSFGNLKELKLTQLPALRELWKSPHQNVSLHDDSFHHRKVVFGNLKKIKIIDCDSIRSLFSSSVVKNLVNLNKLMISKCDEMVKVIEDEEMSDEMPYLLFHSLEELKLWNLPKLQSFCNWRCNFEFPSLETVSIKGCHLLEFFTMKSVSTPNLQSIHINSKEEKDVEDLNGAIRIHFAEQFKLPPRRGSIKTKIFKTIFEAATPLNELNRRGRN